MPTIDELIDKLRRLSPMPEDGSLSTDIIDQYELLISQLADMSDPRCIGALLDSFGYGEGHGTYWKTLHLVESFPVEDVDPLLIDRLKRGSRGTKMWAAYMLGRSRNHSAITELILCLRDGDHLVRRNSAMALGMIGDPQVRTDLETCLDDPSEEVRVVAKGALKRLSNRT